MVSRCTESVSSERVIDAIRTNTMLRDILCELLTGIMKGGEIEGLTSTSRSGNWMVQVKRCFEAMLSGRFTRSRPDS